jgi:hypothetical protein
MTVAERAKVGSDNDQQICKDHSRQQVDPSKWNEYILHKNQSVAPKSDAVQECKAVPHLTLVGGTKAGEAKSAGANPGGVKSAESAWSALKEGGEKPTETNPKQKDEQKENLLKQNQKVLSDANSSIGQKFDAIRSLKAAGIDEVQINGDKYHLQVEQVGGKSKDEYVHMWKESPDGKNQQQQIALRAVFRTKAGGEKDNQSVSGGYYERQRSDEGPVGYAGNRIDHQNSLAQFSGHPEAMPESQHGQDGGDHGNDYGGRGGGRRRRHGRHV